MVISKAREQEKRIRKNLLEITVVCLKRGDIENAKIFGAESARLKSRIETYDYRVEDTDYALADALDLRWRAINLK